MKYLHYDLNKNNSLSAKSKKSKLFIPKTKYLK